MKACDVSMVLSSLGISNYPDSNNPDYTFHFDKGAASKSEAQIQGYVDSTEVEGPWQVVVLNNNKVLGPCSTSQELTEILAALHI